jgi:hypothetical protein
MAEAFLHKYAGARFEAYLMADLELSIQSS